MPEGSAAPAAGGTQPAPAPAPVSPPTTQVLNDNIAAEQQKLAATVTELATQVKGLAQKLEDSARPIAPGVADAAKTLLATVEVLMDDKTIPLDDKNKQLTDIGVQLQTAFSKFTGVAADPKAAARLDVLKAANTASAGLASALATMGQLSDTKKRETEHTTLLDTTLATLGGPDFTEQDRTSVREKLLPRVTAAENPEKARQVIEDAVSFLNTGRAKERLIMLGYKPTGTPAAEPPADAGALTDTAARVRLIKDEYVRGAAFLHDMAVRSGEFKGLYDTVTLKALEGGAPVHPALQKVLDQFDKVHGPNLRREYEQMKQAGGGTINDQSLKADIDFPYTVSRAVIFEAYADVIVQGITSFGTMDQPRDSTPVTRWRREVGTLGQPPASPFTGQLERTTIPSVRARSEIKVGELKPIPRGKLVTDFINIDAIARKLAMAMSDEFISRAKRRPDVSGIALAMQNLVEDIRRCVQQDLFWTMIAGALQTDKVTFTSTQTADGVKTRFQVTTTGNQADDPIPEDIATAVTIVPGSLTVEINNLAVPEFGTTPTGGGPGAAFFFVVDYARGTLTFVNAAGVAAAPANTHPVEATGHKAGGLNALRLDFATPINVDHPTHMNSVLFKVQNLIAQMSENTHYDPDFLISNKTTATTIGQAKSYTPLERRRGFNGDNRVIEGNFGTTADLDHFASSVWPGEFLLVGQRSATVYRVYEPLVLRGPIETRDINGQLTGGKEWYSYQEDAMQVPIPEKLAVVTVYNTIPL